MGNRVLLGMSGGVDSSVAAQLLLDSGYDVIGATMRLWIQDDEPESGGCCSLSSVEDARFVAQKLGIPHYVLNYKDSFRTEVVDYFIREYQSGRTPNPCIACNSRVRFTQFLTQAAALECDYIATGHYARVWHAPDKGYRLRKAVDGRKDQTYMLYRMTEKQLAHTLFPLGELTKPEVRKMASAMGLVVADKPDSQEICFVPDDDYKAFLRREGAVVDAVGPIVDVNGRLLGQHRGAFDYTVGQRKGLGLTSPEPLYVLGVDVNSNTVVVGGSDDLFTSIVQLEDFHLVFDPGNEPLTGKVRYSMHETPCSLAIEEGNKATVTFSSPVRAVTPGQALVLYAGELVVGGGVITKP